jgi:2-hydroxy-3-oxopropionate reductase
MSDARAIGFIGLGIMGKPMVRNLLRAGHPVAVLNRSRPAIDELVADGATTAPTPAAIAANVSVVVTMLPSAATVEDVILGADGVAAAITAGSVVVDMSTIDPATARRIAAALAAKGVAFLDAPVSGGDKGAIEASLAIMVGGDETAYAAMLPIFHVLGKNVTHVGPSGAGQVAKACNQIIVGVTIEAVAEALALAKASGLDPAVVRQALLGGFAQSRILEVHGQRMVDGNFTPGAKASIHRKDLEIIDGVAAETHKTLPAAALLLDLMRRLEAMNPDIDHSGLYTLL